MSLLFADIPSERAILAGLCQYNSTVYYDIIDLIQETSFNDEIHIILFRCIKRAIEQDESIIIDPAVIQSSAHHLGFSYQLSKHAKYIQSLFQFPISLDNVRKFAAKLRKLEIAKSLHTQLEITKDKLTHLTGDETITHILGLAEESIFNFTSWLNNVEDIPSTLGKDIHNYLTYLMNDPQEQVGISTGFPTFDQAIGGGLRPATINVIGARSKVGKTILSDNIGYHIAGTLKIPVLNMDTEMTKEDHIHRTLALMTEIPINDIETGQFGKDLAKKDSIFQIKQKLEKMPLYHKSIAGKPIEDQLAIMRRWLIREVGLHTDGTAKPCVIIYDYLKLMDTSYINKDLKEFQALGFLMTTLHNFATRYKIPILAFIQLNRDGITKESTDTASGSDRIIWLCSNFTILKEKSDTEIAKDGPQHGNRKLVPIVSRHGAGLRAGEYINCIMKGWCAQIKEGETNYEIEHKQKIDKNGFLDKYEE